MPEKIMGREEEQKSLKAALHSKEAELLVVYGRRRIGKTFLICNYFEKQMVFEFTGAYQSGLPEQLSNFSKALQRAMATAVPRAIPASWDPSAGLSLNQIIIDLPSLAIYRNFGLNHLI